MARNPTNGLTAESVGAWSRERDALNPAGKERLGREVLASIVERRARWIPDVRAELARHPSAVLRVEMPYPHSRDLRGRNWDVDSFECGAVRAGPTEAAFRTTVDQLRDIYDLA